MTRAKRGRVESKVSAIFGNGSLPQPNARAERAERRAKQKEQMAVPKTRLSAADTMQPDICHKPERHTQLSPSTKSPNDERTFIERMLDNMPGTRKCPFWDSVTPTQRGIQSDYDPDLGEKVCERYDKHRKMETGLQVMEKSWQQWRERTYGVEIARKFSRGSTPAEQRDAYEKRLEKVSKNEELTFESSPALLRDMEILRAPLPSEGGMEAMIQFRDARRAATARLMRRKAF